MKTHSKKAKWTTTVQIDNLSEFCAVSGLNSPDIIENLIHTVDDWFYNNNDFIEVPHGEKDFCFRFRVVNVLKHEDEIGSVYRAEFVLTFYDFILTTEHETSHT